MPDLSLSLLGPFTAALGERPLYKFRTNKVQALLIYLAVEGEQVHRRETLMNLLWPDLPPPSAQVNLRQTIYRLRQAIPEVTPKKGQKTVPFLLADRQLIQINPEAAYELDVDTFNSLIDSDPTTAVSLYRGDFLADFYLSDSNEFEEWANTQRETLRRQALDALETLTNDHLQQSNYDRAQTYAWQQLDIDNLREIAYRQLMIALMQSGQRSAALAQYHLCRERLRDELDVEPTAETISLYEQIQANTLPEEAQPSRKKKKEKVANGRFYTYLLTDIEGTSRLWDRHQQEMIPVLHRHNAILETQINQHGGRILELHGDGIKAVFENGSPLDCAIAIQSELGRQSWGSVGELRVRVGLHGDTAVDNETALAQTANITSTAWGGQILVSETIHNTLNLPNGAVWQDFGQRQLPDADKPLHLYGLLHPDLRYQNFAPLRSPIHPTTSSIPLTPAPPHNLPQQPNPFIGRKLELEALAELMADPEIRLVTIVGPGGMGKTRLALAAAEQQLGQTAAFPHGVFFIPLAHLQTADQIVPAIAHVLNVLIDGGWQENRADGMPPVSLTAQRQLLDYLRNKQMLLLMDNFEHLLDGAALVTEILQTAVNVQILATSRERLQLREEQVYPIQGLGLPDRATAPLGSRHEDMMQYTAVQLFLQSARRVQPNFELTADDLIYLTRICRAVGGMPLGLELAASWVDMLSLQDIATEIHSSLDLLETDVRNVPERHRSVRAVFDYSWQQLSLKEQGVFAQFAVFRGGFSRTAAQKITGANIRTLSNLVNKSFLQYNQHRDRYELHELMRQYAAEKLAEDAEQETAVRDKHSAYYCIALQHRENELRAGHPQSAMQQIDADQENVRAAWYWAVEQAQIERIDLAITGLCLYYDSLDRLRSGLAACEAASQQLKQLPQTADLQRILAKVLTWHSHFIGFMGQASIAQQFLEEANTLLENAERAGLDVRSEKAYRLLIASRFSSPSEDRRDYLEASLALFRQLGDQWGEFSAQTSLGSLARHEGNHYEAKHWFEKNLRLAREQNNQWEIILAINQLGWVARRMTAYEEAQQLFEQSLTMARTHNSPWAIIRGLESLGYLGLFQGTFEEALHYLQEAITIGRENGMRGDVINHLSGISIAHWLCGRFTEAVPTLLEAQKVGQALGHPWAIAFPTIHLGELQILTGRYAQGREHVQSALLISHEAVTNIFVMGRILRAMGWLSLTEGHFGEAQDWLEQSIEEYQKIGDDEAVIWSTAALSHAFLGLGNVTKARTLLVDALWTAVEIQSFIPLLFLFPVIVLLLHEQGEEEWTKRLHTLAQSVPFLARAQFFNELIWSKLPPLKKPPTIAENSAELRRALWTAVSQLLAEDILVS